MTEDALNTYWPLVDSVCTKLGGRPPDLVPKERTSNVGIAVYEIVTNVMFA